MLQIWMQTLEVKILAKILLITQLVLQYFHYVNKLLTVKFPFSLVLLISIVWQNGKAKQHRRCHEGIHKHILKCFLFS